MLKNEVIASKTLSEKVLHVGSKKEPAINSVSPRSRLSVCIWVLLLSPHDLPLQILTAQPDHDRPSALDASDELREDVKRDVQRVDIRQQQQPGPAEVSQSGPPAPSSFSWSTLHVSTRDFFPSPHQLWLGLK